MRLRVVPAYLSVATLLSHPASGQIAGIHLDTLSTLDDQVVNIEILHPEPSHLVLLPHSKGDSLYIVRGYPTNILIFPDGNECIVANDIDSTFFRLNVR